MYAATFRVKDYGATGQKSQVATAQVQAAFDACKKQGGGEVLFDPGEYTTGTIKVYSNTQVQLQAGATWYASRNQSDYNLGNAINDAGAVVPMLIYAKGAFNISISGMGIIDGQAQHTYEPMKDVDNYIKEEIELAQRAGVEMKRYYNIQPHVRLVYFDSCQNLHFSNFTIRSSPNWTLHVQDCNGVVIDGLQVFSDLDKGVNADGIDVDNSRNVRISNCRVETGDDAICLKSSKRNGVQPGCENVVITNCVLISTSTALKLGTESHGYFRNVVASNCIITNSNRGLGIFIRDGAEVDNVRLTDMVIECRRKHWNWWGDGDPFHIVLQQRRPESRIGKISRIFLSNISAKGEGTSKFEGHEKQAIQGLSLENVLITLEPEQVPDKRARSAVRFSRVEDLGAQKIILRHVGASSPTWGNLVEASNVSDAVIEDLAFYPKDSKAGIMVSESKNVSINKIRGSVKSKVEADDYTKKSLVVGKE